MRRFSELALLCLFLLTGIAIFFRSPLHAARNFLLLQRTTDNLCSVQQTLYGTINPRWTIPHMLRVEASQYMLKHRPRVAELLAQRALEMDEQRLGTRSEQTAEDMRILALAQAAQGKYQQAEVLLKETIQAALILYGEKDNRTLSRMYDLVQIYGTEGSFEKAIAVNQRIMADARATKGISSYSFLTYQDNLMSLYRRAETKQNAAALEKQALSSFVLENKTRSRDYLLLPVLAGGIARHYAAKDESVKEEALFSQVLSILRQMPLDNDPSNWPENPLYWNRVAGGLAYTYDKLKEYQHKELIYQQMLSMARKNPGPRNTNLILATSDLAHFYDGRCNYALAEHYYKQLLPLVQDLPQLKNTKYGYSETLMFLQMCEISLRSQASLPHQPKIQTREKRGQP